MPTMCIDGLRVEISQQTYDALFPAPPPASTNPADYPLPQWQFKALVNYLNVDAAIRSAIDGLYADMPRAAALARYENSSLYRYDDPLTQQLRAAIGMSVGDLTSAWLLAKDLSS